MKTILVATDFSKAAENAARYAVQMAKLIKAQLMLFHSFQVPIAYNEVPLAINSDDMMKDAMEKINQLKQDLHTETGGDMVIHSEVAEGPFFNELENICKKIDPYTVVMGSQGTNAVERLLFGAHTTKAVKDLTYPIISVPVNAKFSAIKKIGLACDFNKIVETVPLEEIKGLVTDFNAALHILNADKSSSFSPDLIFESGLLQEMIGQLKPAYHFITSNDVDDGIIHFVEENNIDLLIVLPKRHNLLERLTHKSHAKQLVLHSQVPVMALHPVTK